MAPSLWALEQAPGAALARLMPCFTESIQNDCQFSSAINTAHICTSITKETFAHVRINHTTSKPDR